MSKIGLYDDDGDDDDSCFNRRFLTSSFNTTFYTMLPWSP